MNKILVHICCGVDAVYALRKLKEDYPDAYIEGYFYDPNIHPEEEYILRWIETERVCNQIGIKCHLAPYELDRWLEVVKGLENEPERGKRCTVCHDIRLEKTAQFAKEKGFDSITTVLMMSPKKDFDVLKAVGEQVAEKYGLKFLATDFRKNGGVEKMNRLSKEVQLYHQNYCGCMYALFQQRKGEFIPELVSFGKGRLPGSREEKLFIKKVRLYAESLGLPCYEQSFSFVNWRLISSTLKINKEPVNHAVLWFSKSIKGVLRDRVQEIVEKNDKFVVKLKKSLANVWILKTSLREIPLDFPRFTTEPILIVGTDLREKFESNTRLEIQLKTQFDENGESQNLIVGKKEAEKTVEFHSDTLPDGSGGVDIENVLSAISENRKAVLIGDKKVVIYGAKTAGNIGRYYFNNSFINV